MDKDELIKILNETLVDWRAYSYTEDYVERTAEYAVTRFIESLINNLENSNG